MHEQCIITSSWTSTMFHYSNSTPVSVIIPFPSPSHWVLPFVFSCEYVFLKICLWFPLIILYYFPILSTLTASTIAFLLVTFKSLPLFFTYFRDIYFSILVAMDVSVWKSPWCLKLQKSKTQLLASSFYVNLFHWLPSHPSQLGNTKV